MHALWLNNKLVCFYENHFITPVLCKVLMIIFEIKVLYAFSEVTHKGELLA